MKVMVLVKATEQSEAGAMPSEELLADMIAFNEALADAGILIGGDGLLPSQHGARVVFQGDDRTVVDGPFAETKELVAGYWLWEVESLEEAIGWVKQCPHPAVDPEAEDAIIEIRPVFQTTDFGEEFTPELKEREGRIRERVGWEE